MCVEKVRKTAKAYGLLACGDKVLVGVSGGPDSVALLFILNSLKKELGLNLYVAHLDHALRADSRKDAGFVRDLTKRLKLPLFSARVDVKKLARRRSLEEAARLARLNFLFKTAKKIKADKIALGHNLDDQAETVLMRILRGAGLQGLSAILPKRKICGFEVIRPLIGIYRKEIERYLRRKEIKPCRDTSNASDVYLRNKLRRRLIPLLEKEYNKNIKEVLANMAQGIACDYDYLSRQASRASIHMGHSLNLNKISRLHPALRRLLLRQAICAVKGDTRRLTFQHMKEIEDLIANRPQGSIVHLPCALSIVKKKKSLLIRSK